MSLFVLMVVGCVDPGVVDKPADGTGEEIYNSDTAKLTVNATVDGLLLPPLPLTIRDGGDVIIPDGTTNVPQPTGTGEFEYTVGPQVKQASPDHNYYPGEDGYTDDGYPMIVQDYLRLISTPVLVTVNEEDAVVAHVMHVAAGEHIYDCDEGEIYDIDPHTDELEGDPEPWSYMGGWISLVDGRELLPNNEAEHFTSFFSPGDKLVIDGSGLALESEVGNDIVDAKRDGIGSNDLLFTYRNFTTRTALKVECRYDWGDWRTSYYD